MQSTEPVLAPTQALRFIADAEVLLSSSLDYGRTLQQVARLAVPELADWCGLFTFDAEGVEVDLTSGHEDAELEALLRAMRRERREHPDASESIEVARSGEPVLAHDIRESAQEGLDEQRRALMDRLSPRSYMIVPLAARGRSLGSLTLLSTRAGRHYTPEDLAFAETLAGRCAVAIDNARLHDGAERSLRLLDTVFATAPIGLAFVDRDLTYVRMNAQMARYNGLQVEGQLGRSVADVLGAGAADVVALYEQVLRTGEPVHDREVTATTAGRPGEPRHFNASYTPVHGPDGDITGISAVVVDVTERRRLLDAERDGRRRADFLSRAGLLLDASLDYQRTLSAVAEIVVPEVADWCAVSVLEPDGSLRQVAAAHVDPAKRELGEELNRRFPPEARSGTGTVQVARSGRTEHIREVTEEMLVAGVPDPEQLALVRALGLRSVIIAALQARGRTLGALTLASAESGRLFDEDDVQLAQELARRAGVAIDNARLYTERSQIAHALQVKLLPERLPDIPGALLAARYRAAGELNEVGGDFYDVFPRSAHEWAMVVGDVSGKGAEAAAITALARYTLRTAALDDNEPHEALARLNVAMLSHDGLAQFATAVLAYVSAVADDRIKVRLSLAGHPPALVLRKTGQVEEIGTFGTMLGFRLDATLHDTEVVLERGDVLLLYTDGVTEAGPRSAPFGEHGLARVLEGLAGQEPQEVVDAVEQAVVDAQEGQPRDDVALLAISLRQD